MNLKKQIITVITICLFAKGHAQDPIFTQFFMVPETLNTSFTGSQETTSAGIMHRTQWAGLNFSINTQFAFIDNWFEGLNSGIGISVLNHKETTTRYDFTQVNVNYSYLVQVSDEWYLRPSISVGVGAKDFGFQNLLLEDQINVSTGAISLTSIDPSLLNESKMFVDVSSSMLFHNDKSWIGLTIKHLNKPNIAMTLNGEDKLQMFMSAHASVYIPFNTRTRSVNEFFILANFMKQGEYNRFDIGPKYKLDRFSFSVLAATNPFRTDSNSHFLTSINAFVGMEWNDFSFGYSWDFNTSDIGKTGGVYELSVSYKFDSKRNCFGCPNY